MNSARDPARFGDTAVQLGYLRDEQLHDALGIQKSRRGRGDVASPIGSLLQELGLLTPAQIAAVLRQLSDRELPLSEDGIRLAARVKVIHAAEENVVGVTATVPGDATRTVVEMAVALAVMEQGQVLAVDVNVREPSLHTALHIPGAPGFVEHIASVDAAPPPLVTRVAALAAVPAGGPAPDAVSRCMSPEAGRVIAGYRSHYRYVLINLEYVVRDAEAAVTAARCDGVLAVLRAGQSQKGELRAIERMLAGMKVNFSGVVLASPEGRRWRRRA